jgi:hypothetical protein
VLRSSVRGFKCARAAVTIQRNKSSLRNLSAEHAEVAQRKL